MDSTNQTKPALAGPILCYGFAATVAMWTIGFITHHPAVEAPPMVSGILLVFTLLAACIFAGGSVERRRSWIIGLGTGVVVALLNLLVLGSYLVEKDPVTGKVDYQTLAIEAAGFVFLGAVVGFLGGIVGTVIESIFSTRRKELIVSSGEPDWLARFGIVAACAAFPLLILGGLVTSTGSALSVPDWPGTYGANMFLYPIGLMTRPRVFIEHSHRLFGTLVGLTTYVLVVKSLFRGFRAPKALAISIALAVGGAVLFEVIRRLDVAESESGFSRGMMITIGSLIVATVLMVVSIKKSPRTWIPVLGCYLFFLVVVQGIFGGIRVENKHTGLALIHGVVAQLFFALLVAYAAFLSPMFHNPAYPRGVLQSRRPKVVATALLHTTIVQLIFGAIYRHYGAPHAMFTHMGFSLFVVIAALFTGIEFRALLRSQVDSSWSRPQRAMSLIGTSILVCVFVQFALGWLAFFVVGLTKGRPMNPVGEAATVIAEKSWAEQLIPTMHQANGALLLALATLAYVWVRRFWRRPPTATSSPSHPPAPKPVLAAAAE